MRDYNTIQFRSPSKQQQQQSKVQKNVKNHPLVSPEQEEKKDSDSVSSALIPASKGRTPPPTRKPVVNKPPASHTGSTSTAATSTSTNPRQQQQEQQQEQPQQQQRQRQIPSPSMPYQPRSSSPTNSRQSMESTLSAGDALALRRDGAEATVGKLRQALDASTSKDSSAKSALAKSDAVILELRSGVRQLKRQLEKVQEEKAAAEEKRKEAAQELLQMQQQNQNGNNYNNANMNMNNSVERIEASDSRIGELQIQLDRAHAQMLTADMVRKELEDTLEAEQYTWELRVQDQERTIDQLQRECAVMIWNSAGVSGKTRKMDGPRKCRNYSCNWNRRSKKQCTGRWPRRRHQKEHKLMGKAITVKISRKSCE
jgi:hypothetical protein